MYHMLGCRKIGKIAVCDVSPAEVYISGIILTDRLYRLAERPAGPIAGGLPKVAFATAPGAVPALGV